MAQLSLGPAAYPRMIPRGDLLLSFIGTSAASISHPYRPPGTRAGAACIAHKAGSVESISPSVVRFGALLHLATLWKWVLNDTTWRILDGLEEGRFVNYAHAMEVLFRLTDPCVDML